MSESRQHFDAASIPSLCDLHKIPLRAQDDGGFENITAFCQLVGISAPTLNHVVLGAYFEPTDLWNGAFETSSIRSLTHLYLGNPQMSHFVQEQMVQAAEKPKVAGKAGKGPYLRSHSFSAVLH